MFLLDVPNFCLQTAQIWGILGSIVTIIKIVIPLLLIILGMIDLGKAVVASEDKAINKAINTLIHRFIAGIVMFLVPSIVSLVFSTVDPDLSGSAVCANCLTGQGNITYKDENNKDVTEKANATSCANAQKNADTIWGN